MLRAGEQPCLRKIIQVLIETWLGDLRIEIGFELALDRSPRRDCLGCLEGRESRQLLDLKTGVVAWVWLVVS